MRAKFADNSDFIDIYYNFFLMEKPISILQWQYQIFSSIWHVLKGKKHAGSMIGVFHTPPDDIYIYIYIYIYMYISFQHFLLKYVHSVGYLSTMFVVRDYAFNKFLFINVGYRSSIKNIRNFTLRVWNLVIVKYHFNSTFVKQILVIPIVFHKICSTKGDVPRYTSMKCNWF